MGSITIGRVRISCLSIYKRGIIRYVTYVSLHMWAVFEKEKHLLFHCPGFGWGWSLKQCGLTCKVITCRISYHQIALMRPLFGEVVGDVTPRTYES